MPSLALSPHVALVYGLVGTWLTKLEDLVQLKGSRLCEHMAKARQQKAFLISFHSFDCYRVHPFGMRLLRSEGLSCSVRFQPQGSEKPFRAGGELQLTS